MDGSDAISVSGYDQGWPGMFLEARSGLLAELGNLVIDIHHVGSTSIPGMVAKPLIDIMVVVRELGKPEDYISAMEKLGYTFEAVQDPDRYFFRKTIRRTHHVHVVLEDSWHYWRMILFRDRLSSDPELRDAYIALKVELARKFPGDRASYTNGKSEFIRQAMERILRNYPALDARFGKLNSSY